MCVSVTGNCRNCQRRRETPVPDLKHCLASSALACLAARWPAGVPRFSCLHAWPIPPLLSPAAAARAIGASTSFTAAAAPGGFLCFVMQAEKDIVRSRSFKAERSAACVLPVQWKNSLLAPPSAPLHATLLATQAGCRRRCMVRWAVAWSQQAWHGRHVHGTGGKAGQVCELT